MENTQDLLYKEWNYYCGNEFNNEKKYKKFVEYYKTHKDEVENIFKELKLLSKNMLLEWKVKYNRCIIYCETIERIWYRFKQEWEIDVSNYTEILYKEREEFVDKISKDNTEYLKGCPSNFKQYCEIYNPDYDSLVLLSDKYRVCNNWDNYLYKLLR